MRFQAVLVIGATRLHVTGNIWQRNIDENSCLRWSLTNVRFRFQHQMWRILALWLLADIWLWTKVTSNF